MNALEIIGKAAVYPDFRRTLFADVESVIVDNRAHLPPAEEACLRRIVQDHCPNRDGIRETPEVNPLKDALDAVGKAILRMCPQEPCEWP
jgi:hypothetical protein